MISDDRRVELLSAIKYNPKGKVNGIFSFIRGLPLVYSCISKVRVWNSRYIQNRKGKKIFHQNKVLFNLDEADSKIITRLKEDGIVVFDNLFDDEFISKIERSADKLFRSLHINKKGGYNVSHGRLNSLDGMSYEEVMLTEESVGLLQPLMAIPETVEIAFNERLLKLVSNYLQTVPCNKFNISRAFPHFPPIESSFFHKDSDYMKIIHIFIYLVDVDEKRGPFCYIPKTHKFGKRDSSPRSNYDLGKEEAYGRVPDEEMLKYYSLNEWFPVKGKKGSVVIADVCGWHKGPMWSNFDDNDFRDILHLNFRVEDIENYKNNIQIRKEDVKNFSDLQKLFLSYYEVV